MVTADSIAQAIAGLTDRSRVGGSKAEVEIEADAGADAMEASERSGKAEFDAARRKIGGSFFAAVEFDNGGLRSGPAHSARHRPRGKERAVKRDVTYFAPGVVFKAPAWR